jgi:hypothetical protein
MSYDRDAAVNYADRNWNVPCDDGVLWLTNEGISIARKRNELGASAADGWKAMFVKGDGTDPEKAVFRRTVGGVIQEKIISGWAGLADCAHFLSRCLTAGGARINERGVRELVEALQARSDTKTLCEKVGKDQAQRVIDTGIFNKGDMLGYFNVSSTGDFDGRQAYTHSTMYLGKVDAASVGGVTCHTVARFAPRSWVNDSWWLHDGYTYTLIHFSDDDTSRDAVKSSISGWWKLEYAGRTEYYYVFEDGRARYKKPPPPRSTRDPIVGAEGSAYWFVGSGGSITFVWRATGTVEVWSPSIGSGYGSMINGVTPGVLTKL